MEKGSAKRAVLIGLDGTPYTLARRLIEDGTMPNLAQLEGGGALLQMDTSIPDISSVAWASFMTGANPGRHGIYGFSDLQPGSYKLYFPNSKHIRGQKLWDAVGRAGCRSAVLNVPSTYPAGQLSGIMVAGFVAIDLNKASYPIELVPKLRELDYRIDVDASKIKDGHDALMGDILATLERRVRALLYFFDNERWDLFIGVITCTDRLHHFFWDAIEDENHKYHSAFREFYGRVDRFIGAVADRLRGEALFIMSDHGFTRIERQVYLNRWLADNGYLRLKAGARSIEDIAEGSLAFALDPGRIYINLKGRYPAGAVDSSDAPRILEEIKCGLGEISADGRRVIGRIYDRDEIFSGPLVSLAPDLCAQGEYGYDLKGAINKTHLMDREVFTGMHTQDDAMLFIGAPPHQIRSDRPHITDVAPTVLDSMGIPVPEGMDGRSLLNEAG
jgi:predicted AlkP superfamily phosphohydrolase/phosphomutase